ncbi:eEF1A lysine and N-terminal methyltransferase-like [Glandiceps talaboti]
MDLTPKSHTELSSVEYYEKFFKKRGAKAFEWYGEYPELSRLLHKYIKSTDRVLVIGCGNSRLSEDLYDIGYHSITNIDISDTVIKQMTSRNAEKRPKMIYEKMDMMNMEYEDNSFNVVFDKATLDAVMSDNNKEMQDNVDKMFAEINRVLKIGGRYICITLSEQHILKKVLTYFPDEGWMFRVHKVQENEDDQKEFQLPVFGYICTKFKKMPQIQNKILEVCLSDGEATQRVKTVEDVMKSVEEIQQYAMIRQSLNTSSHANENISLDLYSSKSPSPRYTLHVVDNLNTKGHQGKFAIFIVPQGRETDWMFGYPEGRKQLAVSAGFGRLVVVSLHREHQYENIESIKAELSGKVMELAPTGLNRKTQVPFLSVGNDIGKRIIHYQGHSALSGDFIVEDVESSDKCLYRRLIFHSNQNVIQSEAKLKTERKKKGKSGKKKGPVITTLDHGYLPHEHHIAMVASTALLPNMESILDKKMRVLLVGLGGGGLPMFMYTHFSKMYIDSIELDPAIADVARNWFGLIEDERMKVFVEDGLTFIDSKAATGSECPYDIIMVDADSKDSTVGMSCPPPPFVEKEFLKKVSSILQDDGLFVLNLVCRDTDLKTSVIQDIKTIFPRIHGTKIPDQINEIIYASKHIVQDKSELSSSVKVYQEKVSKLQQQIRKQTGGQDNSMELVDIMENLHIIN